MKVKSNDFLNIYYALMGENEIESIRLYDIVEVVKVIYSSSETEELAKALEIEDLDLEVIKKHPCTRKITDDQRIEFSMTDEDIDRILEHYDCYSTLLSLAVNRFTYSKYAEIKSGGKIKMSYDDSNGDYEICSSDSPLDGYETKVFTDGEVEDLGSTIDNQIFKKTRKIVIKNSTYSVVVDYRWASPLAADVRVSSTKMIPMVLDETKTLLNGNDYSYDILYSDKPKIYKMKVH